MKLHEYQAKELFARYGIPVPDGRLAGTVESALVAWEELGAHKVVIKAQVHAGGRGKAGGVRLASSEEEVSEIADAILGMRLVTKQTGEPGILVKRVWVEAASDIDKEYYLAMLVDRETKSPVLVISPAGGMDIEQVAVETPDKILTLPISHISGLRDYQIRHAAAFLGLPKQAGKQLGRLLRGLEKLFYSCDASLVEINPLAMTSKEQLMAVDAKLSIDDAALFRHKDLAELEDPSQDDPREVQAKEADLSYVSLDGNIGCLVNGAGLAMATMDLIKANGAMPANFLDIGGGADAERVATALGIILEDEKVEAILINIFGGIVRCDLVAEGVVAAAKEVGVKVPLVVRLQGTNAREGRAILAKSDLDIIPAESLADAASTVVGRVVQ